MKMSVDRCPRGSEALKCKLLLSTCLNTWLGYWTGIEMFAFGERPQNIRKVTFFFYYFQFITGPANDIIRLQDEKKCLNEIKKKKIKQDTILMTTYKGDLWTCIKLLSIGEGLSF